jgi:hypothetical protein
MKTQTPPPILITLGVVTGLFAVGPARAVDFHVATAQDLQSALTLAVGDYTWNFNFNSAQASSLTLQAEPDLTNTGNYTATLPVVNDSAAFYRLRSP